ncbi:uncharacterized protein EDB91DRAFT_1164455 [Suillus paluster]|uniref:uncharacterized protein n=1 Tax=Suillus paluster TaxID=48578 RepID=UPI001B87E2E2|nr:uncharacterized protein EDB91DRAFT_1164455 [Suillus paluster]KAG1727294.1 hypothetical protein EDB91DRAFT_1164455 [Suillus paluster]
MPFTQCFLVAQSFSLNRTINSPGSSPTTSSAFAASRRTKLVLNTGRRGPFSVINCCSSISAFSLNINPSSLICISTQTPFACRTHCPPTRAPNPPKASQTETSRQEATRFHYQHPCVCSSMMLHICSVQTLEGGLPSEGPDFGTGRVGAGF